MEKGKLYRLTKSYCLHEHDKKYDRSLWLVIPSYTGYEPPPDKDILVEENAVLMSLGQSQETGNFRLMYGEFIGWSHLPLGPGDLEEVDGLKEG